MLILKVILVKEKRGNFMTTPPTIVTIVERNDILNVNGGTRRSKRRMIIKFLIMQIWLKNETFDIVVMISDMYICMISKLKMAYAKSS